MERKKIQAPRLQHSACGACRTRRVRCDLKDVVEDAFIAGLSPTCTSCTERKLICTYEFDDAKAMKVLRRGRRVKEVESRYGRGSTSPQDEQRQQFPLFLFKGEESMAPPQAITPPLNPLFFGSRFFKQFHSQNTILDPQEYPIRYNAYLVASQSGGQYTSPDQHAIGPDGLLIAKVLHIWATSFGVDESGAEKTAQEAGPPEFRKQKCNEMVREVLSLVDAHGILRKPTWDGVRALLLLEPLTTEVLTPMDRAVVHETTISQVASLCSLTSSGFGQGPYGDAILRSNVFWYAHSREGITTGLTGGRLMLSLEDLDMFKISLPPPNPSVPPGSSAFQYNFNWRLGEIPLRLSATCRQIHTSVSGPRARSQLGELDEISLKDSYQNFEICWQSLEKMKGESTGGLMERGELLQFACAWQLVIFECCCTVRDALRRRMSSSGPIAQLPSSDRIREQATRLVDFWQNVTRTQLPSVVIIVRNLFKGAYFCFDVGLTKRSVMHAAYTLLGVQNADADINGCLAALKQMRWCYANISDDIATFQKQQAAIRSSGKRPSPGHEGGSPLAPGYVSPSIAHAHIGTNLSSPTNLYTLTDPPSPFGDYLNQYHSSAGSSPYSSSGGGDSSSSHSGHHYDAVPSAALSSHPSGTQNPYFIPPGVAPNAFPNMNAIPGQGYSDPYNYSNFTNVGSPGQYFQSPPS